MRSSPSFQGGTREPNSLRDAVIAVVHEFNAEGMFGTISLAGPKRSPGHVLLQVKVDVQ
jgi:hypothetical protein